MDREDLKYVEQGVLNTSEELNEATVVDKIKLNQNQDRRVKLTQEQKEQIRDLYNGGGHSLNSLAKQFGVSKKTILLIVNPESKAKNDEYIKNHWKDYYDKEEHTQAMKNTRNYKRDLLDKGEIGNQVELNEKQSANGYQPQKVGKAYKVFRVKNGKLYPPMVANQGGKDTPIGVWLDAEEGEFAGLSKTGRPQVKSTGSGNLAYRPGWHLGDIPRAKQFDRLNKETGEYEFPKDFVWAECDYAMDIDYQPEADEQGYMRTKKDEQGNVTTYRGDKYQHSLAGLKKLPTNRYYKYRTNPNPDTVPWVITGQMKVNRLLSDDEVNEILKQNGIAPIHRQGGDKTLKELGLQESLIEDVSVSDEEVLKALDDAFGQDKLYMWSTYILPNGHFLNPEKSEDELIKIKGNLAYEHEDFEDYVSNKFNVTDPYKIINKYCMKMNITWPYILLPYDRWTIDQQYAFRKILDRKDLFEPDNADTFSDMGFNNAYDVNEPLIIYAGNDQKLYDLTFYSADEIIREINQYYTRGYLSESLEEDLTQDEKDKLEKIDNLINEIYLLRQKSIQEEGEFGIGNLVFKEFRNMGYLDHLKEVKRQLLSKDLSLESLEK